MTYYDYDYDCDLAIAGAGPAGLAAAASAAGLGLDVHVFDEQPRPGGQIYRNIETVAQDRAADFQLLGADYRRGLQLVQDFRNSAAVFSGASSVWDARADRTLSISRNGAAQIIRARHILLSSGAMERPVPIPGWTLPGVMGAGAAQTLLKASALVPDVPLVIAGSGPLIYLIAWQLLQAGAPLQAVLLTSQRYLAALPQLPNALLAGNYLWKGLAWAHAIRRAGVMLSGPVQQLQAEGDEKLQAVSFIMNGQTRHLAAELLLLHEGVVPNTQLAMAAGCEHDWDELQHAWRPRLDSWGNTNIDGISIAGDAGGIGGAQAAAGLGRIAALEIARKLGVIDHAERDRRAAPEQAALKKNLRVRRFLDQLFEPAAAMRIPAADTTLVCRCEEVTAGEIRNVVRLGCPGPNQMKAFTRCGMGPCQGRMCGLTVSEMIAVERRLPVGDIGHYRVRAPVKPLTVGELAQLEIPENR
jgi:NADPH-dependent 2,4-dienoyl-CoA reductase/sulfur reductase-like enzyme